MTPYFRICPLFRCLLFKSYVRSIVQMTPWNYCFSDFSNIQIFKCAITQWSHVFLSFRLFLVRDSSVAGGFVISYFFSGRTYHTQVLPIVTPEERVTYSLDNGRTRFFDLLQMVEYYQVTTVTIRKPDIRIPESFENRTIWRSVQHQLKTGHFCPVFEWFWLAWTVLYRKNFFVFI